MSSFTNEQQQGFFIVSFLFILTILLTNMFASGKWVAKGGVKPWDATKYGLILLGFYLSGFFIFKTFGPMNYIFEMFSILTSILLIIGYMVYIGFVYKRPGGKEENYSFKVTEGPDGNSNVGKVGIAEQKLNKNYINKSWYIIPFGIFLVSNLFVLGIHLFSEGFSMEQPIIEQKIQAPMKKDNILYSYKQDMSIQIPEYISPEKIYDHDDFYNYQMKKYQEEVLGI